MQSVHDNPEYKKVLDSMHSKLRDLQNKYDVETSR